jgi:Leucine-rich repeat (LRR) protein/putative cell wall-binding protein
LRLLLATVLALSGLFLAVPAWADESGGIEPPVSDTESLAAGEETLATETSKEAAPQGFELLASHTITPVFLTPFIDTLEPIVEEKGSFLGALATEDVPINATTFPDDNFRAWLLNTNNINGAGSDALLTSEEIAGITNINIASKNIADLTGVEHFASLEYLSCDYNQLTFLNLSGCTTLTSLSCDNNQLTSLNLSGCTSLTRLDCPSNQLTTLDLSGCTSLTSLSCYDNQLTSLDLSNLTTLTSLYCHNNQLTSLDLSSITSLTLLYCSNNQLTSLDLSGFTSLRSLSCYSNQLTSLNLSSCTSLTYLDCIRNQLTTLDLSGCASLTTLYCYSNQLTSLSLSGCTSLTGLHCDNNQLTSLDLSGLVSLTNLNCHNNQLTFLDLLGLVSLTNLNCHNNQLTSLSLSGFTSLTYLHCDNNQLTSLSLSDLASLTRLHCYNNQLTSLSLSNLTSLTSLSCDSNQLTSLNLSGLVSLTSLDCYNNQLTSLSLSGFTSLTYLHCGGNQLTSLNLSGCTSLTRFDCTKNQLTSLDLSNLTSLMVLGCSSNQLTSLNLSGYASLTNLACYNNHLTSLTLSGSTALTRLYCYDNQLTSLSLSGLTSLTHLDCYDNQLTSLDLADLTSLTQLDCSDNRLLDISGLSDALQNFSGSSQVVAIPVHADSAALGSYLSDAVYDFGAHTITLDGIGSDFDATVGLFVTTALGAPVNFVTDVGGERQISGTVTFLSSSSSSGKDIASFTLAGVIGTIDGASINVTVPHGTDVTSLVPAIAHTGASVFPAGAQNFTSPVTYTVTAEDTTTKNYIVTVTILPPPSSSGKDITSFVLAGMTGTIDGTSINVTVPHGTDVTSLVPVIAHTGTGISPTGAQDFTSPVTYTVTAEDATTKNYTVTVTVLSEPVAQHEGKDRYDTAVRASQKAYPDPSKVDAVVLAYSYNFPDALAASYLAGALDAPILLSDTSDIDDITAAEIKRLSPSTIYIVGGTGSISAGVEDALEAYDFTPVVVRLGGAGREETAYEIANAAKEMRGAPTTVFIADAANFPDALSAGSLSAGQGVPILLTATGSLDEWTQRYLEENDISDIIIVGGPGSVSETVATQLRALSHNPAVARWSGSDRYATSADVLTKAIAKWNLTPTIIGLASGEGFPDALVGGAAVGNRGGLLAITDPDTLSAAAEGVIATYKDGISDVEIFGGTGTIRIADKVQGLLA